MIDELDSTTIDRFWGSIVPAAWEPGRWDWRVRIRGWSGGGYSTSHAEARADMARRIVTIAELCAGEGKPIPAETLGLMLAATARLSPPAAGGAGGGAP